MAKHADSLLMNTLGKRWTATAAPAANTTCVATSPTPEVPTAIMNLTNLNISLRNQAAAAVTSTCSIRDASIAGTVLASLDFIVAAGGSNAQSFYWDMPCNTGNPVVAEFGTPAASVIQKITICGWQETQR